MAISQYLIDVATRHQVYLERLKSGELTKFNPTMTRLEQTLTNILAESGVNSVADLSDYELQNLLDDLTSAEEELFGSYAKKLTGDLKNVSGYEASFAEQALDRAISSSETVSTVSAGKAWLAAKANPIQATGQLLEPFIDGWLSKNVAATEAVIRNAHAQGWTMQQAIVAVRGTKARRYQDGVLGGVQRNVDALVRTAVQHVSNTARRAVVEANEDIVTGERWISTLDLRTTTICRSLDQRVFPVGEGPRPPIHPGCRSTTVPEMDDSVELFGGRLQRAAKGSDGGEQVPAGQSYYTWLKTQPADFQNDAVGPTRGKLLRDGGLSAEEFARLNLGRNFEPLTLDEMRKANPKAFDRAGL